MSKLEELRAKLRAMDKSASGNSGGGNGDKTLYPFWDMETGNSATIRFLPDGNTDNPFFWVEKQMINLTFPGVKGGDEHKEVQVKVPCMEMWGERCAIHDEIRPWFKEPQLEEQARKYWKKRTYLFHGAVVDDPIGEKDAPDNPVRRFSINSNLFKIIKAALLDPDMEELPCDYDNGTNFIINKTQNGKWADYGTSKYARKESPLDTDVIDGIQEHFDGGILPDMNDYLPKKPSAEAQAAIFEMFEASLDGELYDPSRWGKFYRPYGLEYKEDENATPAQSESKAPASDSTPAADVDDDVPFDVDDGVKEDSADKSADDIINMIRNRNK